MTAQQIDAMVNGLLTCHESNVEWGIRNMQISKVHAVLKEFGWSKDKFRFDSHQFDWKNYVWRMRAELLKEVVRARKRLAVAQRIGVDVESTRETLRGTFSYRFEQYCQGAKKALENG